MDPLETLKNMNAKKLEESKSQDQRKLSRLYEVHPLATSSEEMRLRYLAAIALVVGMDNELTPIEHMAFINLAASMDIGCEEADAQLKERGSTSESDIETIFSMIKETGIKLNYLLDVAWMHKAYMIDSI